MSQTRIPLPSTKLKLAPQQSPASQLRDWEAEFEYRFIVRASDRGGNIGRYRRYGFAARESVGELMRQAYEGEMLTVSSSRRNAHGLSCAWVRREGQ